MERTFGYELLGIGTTLQRFWLRVPPNQREYSWGTDEVTELLQDLGKAMRGKGEPYFLGTIMLTKGEKDKREVADGQQRLATTTMILATIRDRFLAMKDAIRVESIENDFLTKIDREAGERSQKVILNTDDNEFFRNRVLARPGEHSEVRESARSHRLIHNGKTIIESHFEVLERQNGAANMRDILNDWVNYIEKDAVVIVLSANDSRGAFVMFETLNDRGVKTSKADLVKNHLFKESDDRLSEAQAHWSSMRGAIESVESIGDSDLTMEYLRLACCVLYGATKEREIMEKISGDARSKSEAIRLLHFLDELSGDYAAILNPDHPKWNSYPPDVRKAIRTINALGITQIRPLMLAVARHFTPPQTASAFSKMISWSVRFLIVGGRGGKLDEGYSRFANDIQKAKIKSFADLKKAVADFVPTDAQFREEFEKARVSVGTLARYYLRALERTARGETHPENLPNDELVINLEHVMPIKWSPHSSDYTQQDVETHAKRLGNLALLQADKNSELGSAKFSVKRKVYKDSTFLLTSQIAALPKWGPEQIERRQKALADLAVKTWPMD